MSNKISKFGFNSNQQCYGMRVRFILIRIRNNGLRLQLFLHSFFSIKKCNVPKYYLFCYSGALYKSVNYLILDIIFLWFWLIYLVNCLWFMTNYLVPGSVSGPVSWSGSPKLNGSKRNRIRNTANQISSLKQLCSNSTMWIECMV